MTDSMLCCVTRDIVKTIVKLFYRKNTVRDAAIMHIFLVGSGQSGGRTYSEPECVLAIQSHPRSLMSVPLENA